MVKAPVAGRVKTRLGRDIGMTSAAWWFRHQLARTIRNLQDPRWETVLAVSPDRARLALPSMPVPKAVQVAQGRGDLGVRMARLFRGLPPGPAVVIGADIPGVRRAHLVRAFAMLGRHEAVFGPALDGGYWLVGLQRLRPPSPRLFEGVRWSSPHALADSLATLPGWRVAMVDVLGDVDRAADLPGARRRLPVPGG